MTKKHKILLITSGGLKGFSGINDNLFLALSENHEVDIFDNKLSGFWKYYNMAYCFLKTPGFSKYFHPFNEIYKGDVAYYRFRSMYYVLKRTQYADKKLDDLKKKYDLIIQTGWLPAILEKKEIPRCIYTDYTMKLSEREYPKGNRFFSSTDKEQWLAMETKSYQNADIVFTHSSHTRQSLIEDYGVKEFKAVIVYAGTNINILLDTKKNYNQKIILFIGIDFERKGGYILLEAFKKVKNTIKDARLIIIGSNPEVDINGVEVKGFVSHECKEQFYNTSSVFAMPSISEPFGLVFLEAMAHKIPCIGTNVAAIPEIIINGETGFLIEPNNPDQLAEKLILLLNDENLMQKMGEAGKKRVERLFTWDKVIERMGLKFNEFLGLNVNN
jgi:glycosyltransferase involved in cell wall biosynthesis